MLLKIQDLEKAAPAKLKSRLWGRLAVGLLASACVAYIAFSGIASRQVSYARLTQTATERAIPTVIVNTPVTQPNAVKLELPGRLEAYARAALFARVSGYLARWKADIGTPVKAGELLAEIEAPDLDQQLLQAQSDLKNAETNAELAKVTNERYQALLPKQTVSRQTADEKASDFAAKQGQVKSANANVDRLKALSEYKRIVAPFDGVVTARNTDVGALINSGSASGSELFVVSDTRRLRLYVNVPQSYAQLVKSGSIAQVTLPERPGRPYPAKVEANSGTVDIASGTTRTQLAVENPNGELMPGAYVNVHIEVASPAGVLSVPASAIIFDKGGIRLAIVNDTGIVSLKTITIARDLGKTVEIATGLAATDRVIESPPDGVVDGDRVKIKPPPDKTAK